ncbi:hypothetical protein BDC45DRAFT_175528 [Circinella umbellata]|nr:hypothetical protein BDC45DRAFT_175528 [Circinella umbellata]
MPKLRKIQVAALKELFNFGTENCVNDSICGKEYLDYKEQQRKNASLSALGLINHLVYLLGEDICYNDFLDQLWSWKPKQDVCELGKAFQLICKHVLSTFHLVHRSMPMYIMNHERTFFCENIIPGLLSLSKTLQFIEFKWCEAEYKSTKSLYLNTGDYDGRATDTAKNIDALGYLKTQNNIELVVVESSSGMIKENTTHTIEDTIKTLECNVAALRKEASHYNNATLETFKKLSTYGIQVIKTNVVLSKTSMVNKDKWKHVQIRNAQIPTTWNDRLLLLEYLELLATLYIDLVYSQEVQKKLVQERVNVNKPSGPLVESVIH